MSQVAILSNIKENYECNLEEMTKNLIPGPILDLPNFFPGFYLYQ